MKIIITILGIVTLSLVTFQVYVGEISSDEIWKFVLIIGVAPLINFKTWIINKLTEGGWARSMPPPADIINAPAHESKLETDVST